MLATTVQFSCCNEIHHNLIPRASWLFDMKESNFQPIRKSRDPGNKVAKYKLIDCTHVEGIAEWRMFFL